jgi:hypothetical protein
VHRANISVLLLEFQSLSEEELLARPVVSLGILDLIECFFTVEALVVVRKLSVLVQLFNICVHQVPDIIKTEIVASLRDVCGASRFNI